MGTNKRDVLVDIDSVAGTDRSVYAHTLQTINEAGDCPFCERNLPRYHSQPILFRNTYWLVTNNAWPYKGSKHHFLLISRMHIVSVNEMTPAAWKAMGLAYTWLVEKFDFSGSTLLMRSGETQITGASVAHLHAQIIIGGNRESVSKKIKATVGYHWKESKERVS